MMKRELEELGKKDEKRQSSGEKACANAQRHRVNDVSRG